MKSPIREVTKGQGRQCGSFGDGGRSRCRGDISVWLPGGGGQRERNELNCGLRSCLWERMEPLWSQHCSGARVWNKVRGLPKLPDTEDGLPAIFLLSLSLGLVQAHTMRKGRPARFLKLPSPYYPPPPPKKKKKPNPHTHKNNQKNQIYLTLQRTSTLCAFACEINLELVHQASEM